MSSMRDGLRRSYKSSVRCASQLPLSESILTAPPRPSGITSLFSGGNVVPKVPLPPQGSAITRLKVGTKSCICLGRYSLPFSLSSSDGLISQRREFHAFCTDFLSISFLSLPQEHAWTQINVYQGRCKCVLTISEITMYEHMLCVDTGNSLFSWACLHKTLLYSSSIINITHLLICASFISFLFKKKTTPPSCGQSYTK